MRHSTAAQMTPDEPRTARTLALVNEHSEYRVPDASQAYPASIVALWPNGQLYSGDLLGDITRYRDLRGRCLDGGCMTADTTASLVALEMKLRQHGSEDARPQERRFFRRFDCSFPAGLQADGRDGAVISHVTVENVSAGGAKLKMEHRLHEGDTVILMLNLGTRDGSCSVGLPARVAWTAADSVGVMFAGAPIGTRPQ